MPEDLRVGSVFMSKCPQLFGLESEPYTSHWSVVKEPDGFAIERTIRAAGWNFFFIAEEVKAISFGGVGARSIQHGLHQILRKVSRQHYNSLELTGIVPKRFLGLPYSIVSAHPRHVQHNCYLDDAEARRLSQRLTYVHESEGYSQTALVANES